METNSDAPPWRLMRLLDGFVTTQLLYVAAKLGIAEQLAEGPRSAADLAEAAGADPDMLRRVLRGLVIEDVLTEDERGRFELTSVGDCLAALEGAALVRGEVYYGSAVGLLATVLGGGTAFDRVHGERFFEHLGRHPDKAAAFQASMRGRSEQEAHDVVAAYDFEALLGTLVDVGGGRGVLLGEILRAAGELRGVLVDLEGAIAGARDHLASTGVGDRVECVAHDFFTVVPSGADTYLLSRVIHDWNDDDAELILRNCRRAMRPDSRLLVVEAVLPEHAGERPAAIRMDLHMLLLLGARERTEAEFRHLLGRCGFDVQRVVMTRSPAGLGVIEAIPA